MRNYNLDMTAIVMESGAQNYYAHRNSILFFCRVMNLNSHLECIT